MDSKNEADKLGIENFFFSYADKLDNPAKLNVEQLKKFGGNELISEQAAQEIIEGLYQLTIITYQYFKDGIRKI